ncbi:reverse transcriptase domain, Reverse transcriptase zinc-binding domain protein [Artemisia annua]|uniref:Reverse transcriptase domain, Reverse transcriptase zinc-binding domain protein n=1 Tax=Artemisia annua TaxID=35608 RepID=A0A2U1MF83_ARTAN|nr:reverse transcriptase domain, Reverse transcriptase zinc-binding domain protein [Artemisia annua]
MCLTLASILCCQPSSFPCSYLGLPIGANMTKGCNWKPVLEKFHRRLTSWKAKTLSYGGRLTLIKSVLGAVGTYFFSLFKAPIHVINYLEKLRRKFFWGGTLESNKMAWIAWSKVCSPCCNGGLGIGSLQASNLAMLTKWWWRFHTDHQSLWRHIIVSIHGLDGGLGAASPSRGHSLSPWWTIIKLHNSLDKLNINLNSIFLRKVGNGSSIKFWNDVWIGNTDLKSIFPRMYYLENFKDCLIMDRYYLLNGSINRVWSWRRPIRDGQELEQYNNLVGLLNNFVPSDSPDSWTCSLNNSNKFTAASMRCKIENSMFGSQLETVYWNKYVPIKVNIHNWRLRLDRLPTRCNLDTRGIDLHSTRCPLCDEALETAQHLFVECMVAKDIWIMIKKWWGLGEYPRQLHDLLSWSHLVPLETLTKIHARESEPSLATSGASS